MERYAYHYITVRARISFCIKLISPILFLFPVFCFATPPELFDPVKISLDSKKGYEEIQDYTATFEKQEFINGKLLPIETIEFKFRKPNDIYMKWITKPNKGQETLYSPPNFDSKLLAHKGGLFGFLSIHLNPLGELAMKNQHHPVFDAGIGATTELVLKGLVNGLERKEADVFYRGRKVINNKKTYVVETFFPDTPIGIPHIVRNGETLWDIAANYNKDMYVILSANSNIETPQDISEGQEVLVPHHYCRKITTYYDTELKILVGLEIYDWKDNLYEKYFFKDLKVNVGLTDMDFHPENPEYNF